MDWMEVFNAATQLAEKIHNELPRAATSPTLKYIRENVDKWSKETFRAIIADAPK